ncbi:Cj0814 family flagellar-dependent secreted protein [Campylobacter lari]|uniref:Cj0814 family flagellar-dependent secreted protein n=1 Tax=Campylobacter lari TaxID=201 RepID=UPI00214A1554|nr:hypothetical protein [Campylobacter lari]MCR2067849.1 hypothetical protein [Campylobacter lari subsp. concheus]
MSIFSINDNSSYGSIISQTKANKENKTSSKTNFANTFVKQNASKLIEIQSNNTQTLALNEAILNQNSIKSDSPNYHISSDFKNSIYALKYRQANNPTSMAYGYSVDSSGYMGSDFNKAAGLPEDFKIHKSTLDELYRFNTSFKENTANHLGISNYYTNIDMADTIRQYYSKFDQIINHSFENSNKTSFSIEDLNSLPKGYSIYNTDFKFMFQNLDSQIITNFYDTQEQYNTIDSIGMQNSINTGLKKLDFSPESMETQILDSDIAKDTFNPDMSVYPKNEDGSYTKEALFMSFLKSSGGEVLEGGNTTLNPLAKAHIEAMAKESFDGSLASLNDIMTGKVDFAQILKAHAQDGWLDSKIYAKENNIAWQNSSIGYGGAWFDNQFNQAKASGYSPSNESIKSYVNSVMDKLNNILNQTRV